MALKIGANGVLSIIKVKATHIFLHSLQSFFLRKVFLVRMLPKSGFSENSVNGVA